MNKLLTGSNRDMYDATIDRMFEIIPDMMSRKIPEANVQQAFVVDTVIELHTSTFENENCFALCVGSYDDTAYEFLDKLEYSLVAIDPSINYSLHEYKDLTTGHFKTIFSTSVIEHVDDDEEFIRDICELLDSGGVAILTCDFNDNYKDGDSVPLSVVRQYTRYDLEVRIPSIISDYGCHVIGDVNYEGEYDFEHSGHVYTFATLVFKKE